MFSYRASDESGLSLSRFSQKYNLYRGSTITRKNLPLDIEPHNCLFPTVIACRIILYNSVPLIYALSGDERLSVVCVVCDVLDFMVTQTLTFRCFRWTLLSRLDKSRFDPIRRNDNTRLSP